MLVGLLNFILINIISNVNAQESIKTESNPHLISPFDENYIQKIYLPLISKSEEIFPFPDPSLTPSPSETPSPTFNTPKVNAPYFSQEDRFSERAIFWFGKVNRTENYANIRISYTSSELLVHVSIFDRLLWYNPSPSTDDLIFWDSVELYLDLNGNNGSTPENSAYRFIGQLNWWENDEIWQNAYQGDGTKWISSPISFTTTTGWRGNAPNDNIDDRGWTIGFKIPFMSLGITKPPDQGSIWGIALVLHDRDDIAGSPIIDKSWPSEINTLESRTWGQLSFGIPQYDPPTEIIQGITIIRHKLNGLSVTDAHVGGHTDCGQDYWPDFFDGWGDANYAGYEQVNIQNQSDVADWPCYSKYYVTFPLDSIPSNKEILSATLTLHQFGNAGGGSWGEAPDSLIQVLTIVEDWDEATLTWNNAPIALENVSQSWVEPIDEFPGWPGVPIDWDVSMAAADAYIKNEPLRLVLYSADSAYHSGKYFISSDTGDWNEVARPSLEVHWGSP